MIIRWKVLANHRNDVHTRHVSAFEMVRLVRGQDWSRTTLNTSMDNVQKTKLLTDVFVRL